MSTLDRLYRSGWNNTTTRTKQNTATIERKPTHRPEVKASGFPLSSSPGVQSKSYVWLILNGKLASGVQAAGWNIYNVVNLHARQPDRKNVLAPSWLGLKGADKHVPVTVKSWTNFHSGAKCDATLTKRDSKQQRVNGACWESVRVTLAGQAKAQRVVKSKELSLTHHWELVGEKVANLIQGHQHCLYTYFYWVFFLFVF